MTRRIGLISAVPTRMAYQPKSKGAIEGTMVEPASRRRCEDTTMIVRFEKNHTIFWRIMVPILGN